MTARFCLKTDRMTFPTNPKIIPRLTSKESLNPITISSPDAARFVATGLKFPGGIVCRTMHSLTSWLIRIASGHFRRWWMWPLMFTAPALLLAVWFTQAWQRHQAVAALEALGGRVQYDYQIDDHNQPVLAHQLADFAWLRELMGQDLLHRAVKIDLTTSVCRNPHLVNVQRLKSVRWLNLSGTKVSDVGLDHLAGQAALRWLDVRHTGVTDRRVRQLQQALPELEILYDRTTSIPRGAFVRRSMRQVPDPGDEDAGLGSLSDRSSDLAVVGGPVIQLAGATSVVTGVGRWLECRPAPSTDEAIELGLAFLVNNQLRDGSWSLHRTETGQGASSTGEQPPSLHSDTAATGLAVLAFLGAGYHQMDDVYTNQVYQAVVRNGLDYLLEHQQISGDLYSTEESSSHKVVRMYSHGIATLALCEAFGMTQDPDLHEPAQRAVEFIIESQDRKLGGWRYRPGSGSDTSVTGWMIMALKSAELAGFNVPGDVFQRTEGWLSRAQASADSPHQYVYSPDAQDTAKHRHGRQPNRTMTAVGILTRLYLGWRRDHPDMIAAADYFLENLPSEGTHTRPERDTYYWYYATQVMLQMRGDHWDRWNGSIHPLLVGSQITDGPLAGSWDPHRPVPDRWAKHAGRIYVTTMNVLSLEVFYRYLPLYVQAAR